MTSYGYVQLFIRDSFPSLISLFVLGVTDTFAPILADKFPSFQAVCVDLYPVSIVSGVSYFCVFFSPQQRSLVDGFY